MNIKIDKAKESDIEKLAHINRTVQELHHSLMPELFKPFELRAVTKWLCEMFKNDDSQIFVAKKGDEIVGYAITKSIVKEENPFCYSEKFLELNQISVLEECQSQGVGLGLWQAVKDYSLEIGCNVIQLNVFDKNLKAIKFYEKIGFEKHNLKLRFFIREGDEKHNLQ